MDAKLPFGAQASPTIFHRISQAIKMMMNMNMAAYQNEFLVVGDSYSSCMDAWVTLNNLVVDLGFQLSTENLVPPTTCLTYLGIEIDAVSMTVSIPEDKLVNIR